MDIIRHSNGMSVHCCVALFTMFLCGSHSVFVPLFSCLSICAHLLFNYSYFYLTKMKYESMMMLFFHAQKCLHSLPLLFVSMVYNTPPFSDFPQVLVCFGLTGHYADAAL